MQSPKICLAELFTLKSLKKVTEPTSSPLKILFISDEIPQSINAGSIQFYRLFEKHPMDKILVVGKKPTRDATILSCKYLTLEFKLLNKFRTSRFRSYLADAQSLGFFLPSLPKSIEEEAEEFKPDIVISLLQLSDYYFPAYKYAKKKNIPFILFCHDDAEDFAQPHHLFKKQLIKLNSKIYQYAKKRFCISPEMAEAWEKKYKVKGDYLYPISSEKIIGRHIEKAQNLIKKGQLTIGYAGSLAYGYKEGINEIVLALENTGSKLKIYRDIDFDITKSTAIEFAGYAKTPEETWDRVVKECDAVILPYTTNAGFKKVYSTHFPSKLPEYLALEIPIIVYGPKYATGIKFAQKHPENFLFANDLKSLEKSIFFLHKADDRLKICKNNIDLLKRQFTNSDFLTL